MTIKYTDTLHPAHLPTLKGYIDDVYSASFGEESVPHTELLNLHIQYMESIHKSLIDSEVVKEEDFRNALFVRFEIATATYYHSIQQTLRNYLDIINDSVSLGYLYEFAVHLAGGEREVQLRVAFVDRYFYNIDHFIQVMDQNFSFKSAANTKSKQQAFKEMLERFGLENGHFTPKKICEIFQKIDPSSKLPLVAWLKNNSDRKIKYIDLYEFFANIRNSLHSNGFSNKRLNNLTVGRMVFESNKKEALRCLSLAHLLVLLIPITKVLEEVVIKSVSEKPGALPDPWREAIKASKTEKLSSK